MNKISKKIVALATMAAFVLTLVPAAAFAAPDESGSGAISYQASGIFSEANTDTAEAVAGDELTVSFQLRDSANKGTSETIPGQQVKVWGTTSADPDTLSDAVVFSTEDGVLAETQNDYVYKFANGAENNTDLTVTFTRPGTYVLYASVGDATGGSETDVEKALNGKQLLGKTLTVTVSEADVTAEAITLTDEWNQNLLFNNGIATLNLVEQDQFHVNGTDTYTLKGVAYEDTDKTKVAAFETFSLSSDKNILQLTKDEVTTNNAGEFEITFRMTEKQNANITITNDEVTYTVRVIEDSSAADDIDTIEDGGYVLDGKTANEYKEEYLRNFGDAVQFTIIDEDGDVVTGDDAIATEPAHKTDANFHAQYIAVTSAPTKSELTGAELELVADGDNYTLQYASSWEEMVKDLIPGEYTVRVSLTSGDYADATFTVAEYGTTKDIALDMRSATIGGDGTYYTLTDEVMLGQNVRVMAKYVDENGLKIPATNVQYGFDGKAVKEVDVVGGYFNTEDNSIANESLLGTEIVVSAFDANQKQLVQKTLTVVDSYNTYTLAFDPTEGPAGEDNTVGVSVVDSNDNVANRVNGTLMAYLADQSNKDAKVSVNVDDQNVENGKGELVVYADQSTEVEVVVAVKNDTGAIYAKTLTFNVGDADVNADRSVVMTIGSTEYVVNNNIITGDAAPYVDSAWRTMVPIRALAEAFDATVTYENDDQTVTIVDGGTEVVMTIGEATYTVNGEEQTMDTEAVIGDGDRTYVPIRFTAEALGYTVTPLYDANGLTASVVFQK